MRHALNKLVIVCALLGFVFGCMSTGGIKAQAEGDEQVFSRAELDRKYPESAYLKAIGTARSESGARDRAVSALSRIFVSKIKSETVDSINSVMSGGQEVIRESMRMRVNVTSSAELEGVEIAGIWREDGSTVYALAVLDRQSAGRGFNARIAEIDNLIRGHIEASKAEGESGMLVRYRSLLSVSGLWADRTVLVSRLNVLGYSAPESGAAGDVKAAIRELQQVKSRMKLYVDIKGISSDEMADGIAEGLGKAGFVMASDRTQADVLIGGSARTVNLDMSDPDWKFARAIAELSVMDVRTGEVIGEVSDNVRSAKVTHRQAAASAIRKLTPKVLKAILKIIDG